MGNLATSIDGVLATALLFMEKAQSSTGHTDGYTNDNLPAYDYLSSDGVDVKLDNETDTVHLKFVLIDDETMKSCA